MHHLESAIRAALDEFDIDQARLHLRDALRQDPTAEIYYLASLAAVHENQRVQFLEKALELDPFHAAAYAALHPEPKPTPASAPLAPPAPPARPATPVPAPAAPPPAQPAAETWAPRITADQAVQIRSILNSTGYRHPNNAISANYNATLNAIGLQPMDPEHESVIAHCFIGKMGEAWARDIKLRIDGEDHRVGVGHLLITNQRMFAIETGSINFFKPKFGYGVPLAQFRRIEPIEYSGYTRFSLYAPRLEMQIDMSFTSLRAGLAIAGQILTGLTDKTDHTRRGVIHYVDHQQRQAQMQNYINSNLARSANLKQAFTQTMLLLINGLG